MAGTRKNALPGEPRCGHPLSGGNAGPCPRPAGYGTDHPGTGKCLRHGGGTKAQSRKVAAAELATLLGEPADVDPSEALLFCVALASQEVHWVRERLAEVTEPTHMVSQGNLGGPQGVVVGMQEELDIWIQQQQYAVERLARYAKMALDAGVAERMVSLAEKMGDLIAPLLQGVLGDLELSPMQQEKVQPVVARHLRLLEARTGGPNGQS